MTVLIVCFEKESFVAQTVLLLPQPSEHWDCRHQLSPGFKMLILIESPLELLLELDFPAVGQDSCEPRLDSVCPLVHG